MARPQVVVKPELPQNERSHDISLDDGTEKVGFRFQNVGFFQKVPVSDPMRIWSDLQEEWTSGMGLRSFRDDPSGFADSLYAWTMTPRKLFPAPQFFFSSGTRVQDYAMPGNVVWQPLYGTTLYASRQFTAGANNTAVATKFWIRRVGTPGTLTYALYSNTGGDPNAAIANSTVTKTTADVNDTVSRLLEFTYPSAQTLTASTVYHHVLYGATTDNADNHWEIGVNAGSAGGDYKASSGASWSEASFSIYFQTTDAEVARRLYFFNLEGATYCVTRSDDTTVASKIYINGDRGTATGASAAASVTLDCSAKSWTVNEWAGAYVRIIDGAGDGQIRVIASNTSNQLTVTSGWTVALTTASKFVIYSTPLWKEVTGHGLGVVVSRPAVAEKTVWFPQGTGTAMRRGIVNGNSYTWTAEDATTKYDYAVVHHSKNEGIKLWLANAKTSAVYKATPTNNTQLTLVSGKTGVGSGDYLITNMVNSGGKLWVGKEDGLFYIESGTVTEIESGMKSAPDPTNCVAMTFLGSTLYYGWGHSMAYLLGSEVKDILNYRTSFEGVPEDRRGYVSAAITVLGWVIVAIDGGTDNFSSVRVYNGVGWHEIFRTWKAGVRIRDLWYQANPETRGRLWMDVGGQPMYIDFPKYASNPTKDSTLTYQHEGVVTTGTYSVDKEQLYKLVHEIRVASEDLAFTSDTSRAWIEVDYQMNGDVESSTWYPLATLVRSPFEQLTMDLGEVLLIRFRFRMLSTVAITPAKILSFEVNGTIAQPEKYQYVCTFKVGTQQQTYDGQDDFAPSYLDQWIREAHTKRKKLLMRSSLIESDNKTVTISLAMPSYESIEDGDYAGVMQVVLQEA